MSKNHLFETVIPHRYESKLFLASGISKKSGCKSKITDKKNNESRGIIEMLLMINAVHCMFAWDAINTRQSTLNALTEAGGDFIVCVKSNQETYMKKSSRI